MPQISVVGTGGDYTTLAAWDSAEGSIDYGVGNPAVAEITGRILGADIRGQYPRGLIIRAKAGEEYDFTNHATAAGCTTFLAIDPWGGVESLVENISVISTSAAKPPLALGYDRTTTVVANNCYVRDDSAQFWPLFTVGLAGTSTATINNCVAGGGRRSGFTASNGTLNANNCLAIDCNTDISGARGGFEVSAGQTGTFTNCLAIGNGNLDFAQAGTGSDYNAGSDTSAPGANSLDSRTTADLADYAGGDYRTASGSALATAGSGGTFIGADLEAGGTPTITGTASHSSAAATHSATGSVVGVVTGTGSHQASASTQAASGVVGAAITGTASHQSASATHAATGERSITGTSSGVSAAATHTASAFILKTVTGSGSHQSEPATHEATVFVGKVVTGSGSHQAIRYNDLPIVVTDISLIAADPDGARINAISNIGLVQVS